MNEYLLRYIIYFTLICTEHKVNLIIEGNEGLNHILESIFYVTRMFFCLFK